MVQVVLRTVWLNLASDLSQVLAVPFVSQINYTPSSPGEDRMYGAGRYRSVEGGATQRRVALAFQACTPDEVVLILRWDRMILLYRDDLGTKIYGSYRGPQINRHPYDKNADVTLNFTEKTVSEALP